QERTTDAELTEVIWEGNTIKCLDLYNTFWDIRVEPTKISEDGEFAGYNRMLSGIALIKLLQSTPGSFNHDKALKSNFGGTFSAASPAGYYVPQLNRDALILPEHMANVDWLAFVGLGSSK